MRAEYILKAIAAFAEIEKLSHGATPGDIGRASALATICRIQLTVHSGLDKVEIPVEIDYEGRKLNYEFFVDGKREAEAMDRNQEP